MKDHILKIILANPRGYCAGVDRAIKMVEAALCKYGSPVYVRHEIVHNKFVCDDLRKKGAIFVEELHEIPEKDFDRPVLFSAHGVAQSVVQDAKTKNMQFLDATCPLVSKVHSQVRHALNKNIKVVLIGHAGHPEVIGTLGQAPAGYVTLVQTVEDVGRLNLSNNEPLLYCCQTTLSVSDTSEIIQALQAKYPNIMAPEKSDICYATTNRQDAVKELAKRCDLILIIGAANSSNTNRMVDIAKDSGCKKAFRIDSKDALDFELLQRFETVGISSGASVPEYLVEGVIEAIQAKYDTNIETLTIADESDITFALPGSLRSVA